MSRAIDNPICRPCAAIGAIIVVLVNASGCVQEMANQPRVEALEPSEFFADGQSARQQVPGTIAQGQTWETSPLTTGQDAGKAVQKMPVKIDAVMLHRGQMLFGVICKNCHGWSGHGDGIIVQRGFPKPPSYHIDRLRNVPDGHIFRVVTEGFGRMPSYRTRLEPNDRWAVIAYVRALQLSQQAPTELLTEAERASLEQTRAVPPAMEENK